MIHQVKNKINNPVYCKCLSRNATLLSSFILNNSSHIGTSNIMQSLAFYVHSIHLYICDILSFVTGVSSSS